MSDAQQASEKQVSELTHWELQTLGEYNAECMRGIVHRDDWCGRMATLQERFDAQLKRERR